MSGNKKGLSDNIILEKLIRKRQNWAINSYYLNLKE